MEEGSLRCDANVSVRPVGTTELGTKTELKNMNSFRFLERGVRAEIERQIGILRGGGTVVQETLHFDPASGRITLAALQGGGTRLPLLPGAGSRSDRGDGGDARGRARRRCPSCRPHARRASQRELWPRRPSAPTSSPSGPSRPTTSSGVAGGRVDGVDPTAARQLDAAARRADRLRRRSGGNRSVTPASLARSVAMVECQAGEPRRRTRGSRAGSSPTAATPARSSSARGWAR